MKSGLFHVPYTRPDRTPRQVFDYSVLMAQEADAAGYQDFMIGEHATQAWEAVPNPEIVIAACARETERLRFAPMAHLLGLHEPGGLAIQIGYLSQILEGRYFLGIGSGAYPRDAILRGQPADLSESQPRRDEALEIIRKIWDRKPFYFEGQFFKGGFPEQDPVEEGGEEYHLLPNFGIWGGPENLEIAMSSITKRSKSMRQAGAAGFSPILFFAGIDQAKGNWEVYSEAAVAAGRTPDRGRWRICRDVIVADTDAEAKRLALSGGLGQAWEKYLVPVYTKNGLMPGYIEDSGTHIDVHDITMDWIAEHVWICGSEETVLEKLQALNDDVGGFGQVVMNTHDFIDDPKPFIESMHRFAKNVVPKVRDAVPAA
jgi:alkanesulfonate monooxygenase SsuD/methylene tetrahydromethanopterin reductase-like flavin-dependent oxidoreductase (luciferase family)